MTEAYISPHSLLFGAGGARFVAGSESLISVFDVSRPGQEPLSSIPTGPKRRNTTEWNAAVDMRGIVSALAIDATTGTLAAGTYGRQVGLYDAMGQGGSIAVFSVKGTDADAHIGGGGVTQVSWSPCGRYLYIAERKSNGIVLYDIRQTGHLLAWLEGRNAQTNQRLGFDVVTADGQDGHEVWAGGMDGYFRVWENPHTHEGSVSPTFEFKGHEGKRSYSSCH
jgi:WD40 repeat protein